MVFCVKFERKDFEHIIYRWRLSRSIEFLVKDFLQRKCFFFVFFVAPLKMATVCSASRNRCSASIFRKNSKAVYTHCFSHRLNLSVSKSTKIDSVSNMMEKIKTISDFSLPFCFHNIFNKLFLEKVRNQQAGGGISPG